MTLRAADIAALLGAGEVAVTAAPDTEVQRQAAERFIYHRRAVQAQLARQTAYQPIMPASMPSERLASILSRLFGRLHHA